MTEARDDADVEDVPGAECSARMVVVWAIQALFKRVRKDIHLIMSRRPTQSTATY